MKKKICVMLITLLIISLYTPTISAPAIAKVTFLDVGQGDCILIQSPDNKAMLIDAGNNGDAKTIVNYLKKQNIKKLDIVIGTHPHEDHIGSLDKVIDTFEIGEVYMPKATANTETFKDVIIAMQKKKLKINTPVPGKNINLGKLTFNILAPSSSNYEETNNYSIVLRMAYGKTSFMFTGDAEELSEKEILKKYNVKADVLKVGHHGSDSSTSAAFFKAVNPKYAVISVGKDNKYKHPSEKTLEKLKKAKIDVLRTDIYGNIEITTDGNSLTIKKEKEAK